MSAWLLGLSVLASASIAPAVALQDESEPGSTGSIESFERGIDAYRRGEYAEADAFWRECLELPLSDAQLAVVTYDLANAAWRRGEPLVAVGWYSTSLRYAPRDRDTWYNLELVRGASDLEPADRGDLRSTSIRLIHSVRPQEARALVLGALALLALVLAGEALRGGVLWRRCSWAAAILLVVVSIPWVASLGDDEGDPLLIIRAPTVALRSEPRRALEPIADVEAGERVQRIDALPGWVRVETEAGERGWLQSDAVFELIPKPRSAGG